MFGYLRFFLALLVLISHLGIKISGLNPGVFAVVIFYILAGYVTTYLFYEVIPKKNKIVNFYIDRVIRIFPLYLIILTITALFVLISNYGNPKFNFFNTLSNIFIIPLNYYMYIDVNILTNPKWPLIPPAWSLGTELQAYMLLPFLLLNKKLFFTSFIISFTIYSFANFSLLHPDYFGYRLLAGVLFIFLIGSLLRQKSIKPLIIIYLLIFFEFMILLVTNSINKYSFSKETLLGLLIGIPIIWLLHNKKNIYLNKLLGRLSYSLFLLHFPAIWLFKYIKIYSNKEFFLVLLLILSIIISSIFLIKLENIVVNTLKTKIKR